MVFLPNRKFRTFHKFIIPCEQGINTRVRKNFRKNCLEDKTHREYNPPQKKIAQG